MQIKRYKKRVKIELFIAEAEAINVDFTKSITYKYWDNETTKFLAKYLRRELFPRRGEVKND